VTFGGLTTPRLSLRELRLDDLEDVTRMMGDEEVTRFYPKIYTVEDSRHWLRRQLDRYARDGHGLWRVGERSSDAFVGQCGLVSQVVDGNAEIELGYLLAREHWGRGYATEAARAALEWGFRALRPGRMISLIDPDNAASQRTARRLGMRRVGETAKWGRRLCVFATRQTRS
jgi:ribosomal-protein-alanine N-acetyltransferase